MSTHIIGLISSDNELYQKHLKVLKVCRDASVSIPKETYNYFSGDYEGIEDQKLEVELKKYTYETDMTSGYEIIVSEIPEGVERIRFTNTW